MTRRALAILALLACSPALAQEPLPPGLHGVDKLEALVQRVSQVQAGLKTLSADFELRRTSRLLAQPSVSRGKFYFAAPDSVRWDYTSPRPMTVLLAGGVAITYRPLEKRAESIKVGRAQRRVFHFLSATEPLDKLMGYFSFTFRRDRNRPPFVAAGPRRLHRARRRQHGVLVLGDRGEQAARTRHLQPVAASRRSHRPAQAGKRRVRGTGDRAQRDRGSGSGETWSVRQSRADGKPWMEVPAFASSSFPRKRESSRGLTNVRTWIPAFAGMTNQGIQRRGPWSVVRERLKAWW